MTYCSVDDVKNAVNFPATGAPISDTVILDLIKDSQDEINYIYHTKFGSVDDNGTASAGANSTLTDGTKTWTVDSYTDSIVWITGGTGVGQFRLILSNTATVLTVSTVWDTNPDNTSTYRILPLGYKSETVDGNGTITQFTRELPLINLSTLTIDEVDVTVSSVYQYPTGKLTLKQNAEQTIFTNSFPQQVEMSYVYGVYPLPRIIKRLCVILAAMRTLTAQIAGTYDDFTSITLPGVTGSKGEPYTNIRESVNKFQSEAKAIIGDVEQGNQLEAKGWHSYRPFTQFG